ncbi:hypothetical protein [Mycobacterium tuberculosis]|uniref:hypothetical protein n=1 Tax=Mycobacterium tuberculosis TaxID=1773 RepID=UPI00272CD2FF|nr:hypothetical protein [Mycobacterium tuberculosis]
MLGRFDVFNLPPIVVRILRQPRSGADMLGRFDVFNLPPIVVRILRQPRSGADTHDVPLAE